MRGKSYPIYKQSQPTEEQPPMASNILGEDSSGFDFEYSSSIEEATPPEPLPERDYIGEIVEARKGVSNFSGNAQLVCIIVIPVENFPVDYAPDNAPDGMRLVWFSPDVDDSRKGKWQMRMICQKLGVPMTNHFRTDDFVGKRVRVELGHRTGQDEVTYNTIKGMPSLAT
jgi:hypothetical protein